MYLENFPNGNSMVGAKLFDQWYCIFLCLYILFGVNVTVSMTKSCVAFLKIKIDQHKQILKFVFMLQYMEEYGLLGHDNI